MSDQIDSKLSEIGILLEELKRRMERAEMLEKEIGQLLFRANLLPLDSLSLFIAEVMLGIPELDRERVYTRFSLYEFLRERKFIYSGVAALRALARRGRELRKMCELAERLRVPEFPYEFSRAVEKELGILDSTGLEKVRVKQVELVSNKRPLLRVLLENKGTQEWREIRESSIFLVYLYEELRELIGEAIDKLEKYCEELEGLRTRIVTEHPREILVGDL
jgi:hypothetical protein